MAGMDAQSGQRPQDQAPNAGPARDDVTQAPEEEGRSKAEDRPEVVPGPHQHDVARSGRKLPPPAEPAAPAPPKPKARRRR